MLENGIMGILLVLFFLALFLNARLAFWVAFGLPISFLGMFIFAAQLGGNDKRVVSFWDDHRNWYFS